jgi:hypothetical protein
MSVAHAGASHAVVVVEPLVLPTGAGTDVGGRPTATELNGESSVLMLTWRVGGVRGMHHPVLWQRTTGWGCHSLRLLALLVSTDGIVCYDGIAEELRKGATSAERQTLQEFGGQASHEASLLHSGA